MDTSAWFALAVPKEYAHAAVSQALREAVRRTMRIVTTNLVVAESHVLLRRRVGHEAALAFVREVGRAPNVVVFSTPDIEARALGDWLEPFADQDLSYTDAVSFAVMSERRIRSALSLDRHFAGAGFEVLPRA